MAGVADLDGQVGDEVVTVTRLEDGSASFVEARRADDGSLVWTHRSESRVGQTLGDRSYFEADENPHLLQGVRLLDLSSGESMDVVFIQYSYERGQEFALEVPPGYSGAANQEISTIAVTALDGNNGDLLWRTELDKNQTVRANLLLGYPDLKAGTVEFDLFPVLDENTDGVSDVLLTVRTLNIVTSYGVRSTDGRNSAYLFSGASGHLLHQITSISGSSIRPVDNLQGSGRSALLEIDGQNLIARTLAGTVIWIVPNLWAREVQELELDGDPGVELLACRRRPPFDDLQRCGADGAVAINGDDGAVIWQGTGSFPTSGWTLWSVGDISADGLDDLIALGCTKDCASYMIRALSGPSLAVFWGMEAYRLEIAACCEDYDGDGKSDVTYIERKRDSESPYSWSSRTAARSGSEGRVLWESDWALGYGSIAYYPARGDFNANGTRDLVSLVPLDVYYSRLVVHEGSTSEVLWEADFPEPGSAWFGDTRDAQTSAGTLPILILDVYPVPSATEFEQCRVHAMNHLGVLWSHPTCDTDPGPTPSPSPTPTTSPTSTATASATK